MITTGGQGGSGSPMAVSAGRSIFWFNLSAIAAGVDLQEMWSGLPVNLGFSIGFAQPIIPLAGKIKGIIMSKAEQIASGTLTIKPYTKASGSSTVVYRSGIFPTLKSGDRAVYFKTDTYSDTDTLVDQFSTLGIRVQASSDYNDGGNNDIVIGIVIDF